MSRRTKLILLGVFLVLCAIPVVHGFLTWSPVDPLHVSFSPPTGTAEIHGLRDGTVFVDVAMENRSATTVYLTSRSAIEGTLLGPKMQKYPKTTRGSLIKMHASAVVIPPQVALRTTFKLSSGEYDQLREGKLWAGYRFKSQAKQTATGIGLWITRLLPQEWRHHVPLPVLDERATLIAFPPGAAPKISLPKPRRPPVIIQPGSGQPGEAP